MVEVDRNRAQHRRCHEPPLVAHKGRRRHGNGQSGRDMSRAVRERLGTLLAGALEMIANLVKRQSQQPESDRSHQTAPLVNGVRAPDFS